MMILDDGREVKERDEDRDHVGEEWEGGGSKG